LKAIFAATLLSIVLCSCAAHNNANISRNLVGPTVVGDGNAVVVSHVRNQTDGQELAEKHCKQFGKSARFNRMEGLRAYFERDTAYALKHGNPTGKKPRLVRRSDQIETMPGAFQPDFVQQSRPHSDLTLTNVINLTMSSLR
jgi:hypothetical protein